ncbi:MAG: fumarylacetoacetate hydrolase family protein [Hyphomonadaceae bacterium]|nr:fumarylacetoacetate hydrolase family protein [Hyphomonadaceae bacterium]
MTRAIRAADILPEDETALLIGRVWSTHHGGPCPVFLDGDELRNLTGLFPTMSTLLEQDEISREDFSTCPSLGSLSDFLGPDAPSGNLLAPCDLQAIKAAGVTFATSMLERVIEERAEGDAARAEALRAELAPMVGGDLSKIRPGSTQAAELKAALQEKGVWSQYLEVGIGPDAEIFTKAQPMSAVGCGAEIGVHPMSDWNNPEPEVALAVNSRGEIRGATLANDVNLRDVEGRSALLLGKAKDNNASCAIGPFIRLFDESFTLADVEQAEVRLEIEGEDGFVLSGASHMSEISRPPADLVAQTLSRNHQYPDGVLLLLGTMFAPVQDRRAPGEGFTHEMGDRVAISTPALGRLVNWVTHSDIAAPWTFGVGALMANLARRGVL